MSRFALSKLLCSQEESGLGTEACLALLSQRFSLDVVTGNEKTVSFVNTSIARHMRYLFSTSDDCYMQHTVYPTEPVLSQAAAMSMHSHQNSLCAVLEALRNGISSSLIQPGELGELLSRLLILISRDFAAIGAYRIRVEIKPDIPKEYFKHSQPFPSTPALKYFEYSKPVPLLLVLSILFGDDWITPDIQKTFARAYISATHWIRREGNIGPRSDEDKISAEAWLKNLFLRGIAIQCYQYQPLIDGVIPILLLDSSNACKMSCMLIQITKHKRGVDPARNVFSAHEWDTRF
ncbi:hypothetical protein VKT23_009702 [Stygiomarasmius scandens]|uniref:Uncharacterized protein n=1 Tax=Marasmiellus scandens TaxID=2682957 RepID=A0ABR1JH80_9AGAR